MSLASNFPEPVTEWAEKDANNPKKDANNPKMYAKISKKDAKNPTE